MVDGIVIQNVEVRRGGPVREDLLRFYPRVEVRDMATTREERKIHRPDVRVTKNGKEGFVFMEGDHCFECHRYLDAAAAKQHNVDNGFPTNGRRLQTF